MRALGARAKRWSNSRRLDHSSLVWGRGVVGEPDSFGEDDGIFVGESQLESGGTVVELVTTGDFVLIEVP